MTDNEWLKGSIIGITQTFFGYPLDTIKTRLQFYTNNNTNHISNFKHNIYTKNLYFGVKYPLVINCIYNSFLFGIFNISNNHFNNIFLSGFISGSISSTILTPFELLKIQSQQGYNINKSLLYNNNLHFSNKVKLLYRGYKYTFFRESFGSAIYFYSYYKFKENNYSNFISGGFSGVLSWILTYPIDTIKTRYQSIQLLPNSNNNISQNNLNNIWRVKGLWNGISFCIIRAFLINGITFSLYENL
jgi:solute carrier family 25 (mitochondrial carnitine/acylcarnitine transporter), member 20/29